MRGSVADRKQMFDIGITGPLAGLLVALPICWIGVRDAVPSTPAIEQARQGFAFNNPLLIQLMVRYHHPELPADTILNVSTNPLYLAGWMAMLITGLNMVPVSQLDGGHVSYALFGKKAHWLARGLLVLALTGIMITRQYFFIVMILLIVFVIGPDHPPTANDQAPMGRGRKILGYLSLAIPIFCLAPVPILLPG
jgi:membrane-associated protease RseP (regulator of RpoE activity)